MENSNSSIKNQKPKILGIGGVFFKSKDPDKLRQWYENNLGMTPQMRYVKDDTTIAFRWKSLDGQSNSTVWAPFKQDTKYFNPSTHELMINYIVRDLDGLLKELTEAGVEQVGDIESFNYGRFAWVLDPEGNKLELWEPTDFGRIGLGP